MSEPVVKRVEAAQVKQRTPVHMRWMIRRDMAEVFQIEQASFEFAWTEEDFHRCLRQRNCIGMVAEHLERVIGFMIYELHKSRLHVLNFAVSSAHRREQVGSQMISKLVSKLSTHRRTKITMEIRETNLAAQIFLRKNDFKAVKTLKNYFDDTGEDAYYFETGLSDPKEIREELIRSRIGEYFS